jgi:hypothetical protein
MDNIARRAQVAEDALRKILRDIPAYGENGFFIEHISPDGDPIGCEQIDPAAVIQHIRGIAMQALGSELTFESIASQPGIPDGLAEPDVDWLASIIRSVDGNHKLGAGALAEKIVEALATKKPEELK